MMIGELEIQEDLGEYVNAFAKLGSTRIKLKENILSKHFQMNEKAELIIEVNTTDYKSSEELKLAQKTNEVITLSLF